jgi:uncharacterized membrane protein
MGDLALIVLTANSKEGATKALEVTKQLDRDGWIELMDYGLISKDNKGHVTMREMDDDSSEKVAAAVVGVAGGIASGVVGAGALGVAAGVAGGVLAGAGSMRLMEKFVRDTFAGEFPETLDPNTSALAVVVEERYVEQLDEQLKKLGRTVERDLKRAERDAEFQAYLQRSKDKIHSLQQDIQVRLAKTETASAAEKAKLEAEIAAKRAEMDALADKMQERIKTMSNDIKSEVREMNFRFELAGLRAKEGIGSAIDDLHRQLNHYNDELEQNIEHQIELLKAQASELKTKAAKASGETKSAIESHLNSVELRLHNERAKLQDSFEERLLQLKQWFENLRVQSNLFQADARDKLNATIRAAQHSLAELKAHVCMRKREDDKAWKDIRASFDRAAKDLQSGFDQAKRERA